MTYDLPQEEIELTRKLVAQLYKNDQGQPLILTDGQCVIFDLIFRKRFKRNHLQTFTRYGKSLAVALAVLTRVSTYPERWCIAAGNDKQAGIIMAYLIGHIFDNDYTRTRFLLEKGESEEAIRRYKNKNKINFRLDGGLLGEVFITNAKGAMGFGAPNVIEDEAALIPDTEEALVMRMLGDQTENFLLKIGNPWDSGHFRASFEDPNYHKVVIDYRQGILEGRFTFEQEAEMRKKPFWDVLYECKFPALDAMNEQGWIPLLTKDDIDRAMVDQAEGFGMNRLGGDIAGGGKNFSVLVQRQSNVARVVVKTSNPDTMSFAETILTQRTALNLLNRDIFLDKVGIGRGVVDILTRNLEGIRGVNAGDKPEERFADLYVNLRAQMYWTLRTWILAGGKLLRHPDWYQLTKIKYRKKLEGMRGKLQIMSKEDMLKEGTESPDVADALALTFTTPDILPNQSAVVFPDNNADFERREPIVTI